MHELLFEIGTEEIPAGYIQPALDALAANVDSQDSFNCNITAAVSAVEFYVVDIKQAPFQGGALHSTALELVLLYHGLQHSWGCISTTYQRAKLTCVYLMCTLALYYYLLNMVARLRPVLWVP